MASKKPQAQLQPYKIWMKPAVHVARRELPGHVRQQLIHQIDGLGEQPRPVQSKELMLPNKCTMTVKEFDANLTNQWPGIAKTPRVVDGDACIVRTLIPVWGLEGYHRLGWADEEILENFPSLSQQDLENAWSYVLSHKSEIDQAIRKNEEA